MLPVSSRSNLVAKGWHSRGAQDKLKVSAGEIVDGTFAKSRRRRCVPSTPEFQIERPEGRTAAVAAPEGDDDEGL